MRAIRDNAFEHIETLDQAAAYFNAEGLADLVAHSRVPEADGYSVAIEPDIDDLVRLHQLVRERRAFTVLEFGIGEARFFHNRRGLDANGRYTGMLANQTTIPTARYRCFVFPIPTAPCEVSSSVLPAIT